MDDYLNWLVIGGYDIIYTRYIIYIYINIICKSLRVPSTTLPNKSHTPNNEASHIRVIIQHRPTSLCSQKNNMFSNSSIR